MKVKFIPVYQFPPIVDVGADYEADGGQCSSGDGAVEMSWPLPVQAPVEPMPPCMEFYQVRKQKLITELTQILQGLLHNCNVIYYCSGARRPPLLSGGSPGNLAIPSTKCHSCSSLPLTCREPASGEANGPTGHRGEAALR